MDEIDAWLGAGSMRPLEIGAALPEPGALTGVGGVYGRTPTLPLEDERIGAGVIEPDELLEEGR
ncbi:hypothetical protein Pla163_26870 [Planctomycetes bacterium Pla163]|uniref:Uncharacterized protein n=1 Tax=Rohdeia mirabilis TaxID=2528008 RepID=A0A518D282_9BACT|nr:hypothetical protein Pla163_26870 [Planctomycetes bacterium Pla163]